MRFTNKGTALAISYSTRSWMFDYLYFCEYYNLFIIGNNIFSSCWYMYQINFFVLRIKGCCFLFLFCFGFFVPLDNFSLVWRRHLCRRRAVHFYLCSLMAIEQWGFFSMQHLLCHEPFIMVISEDPWPYTYFRALSNGAVTTCFYDLGLSRTGCKHYIFYKYNGTDGFVRRRRWVSLDKDTAVSRWKFMLSFGTKLPWEGEV